MPDARQFRSPWSDAWLMLAVGAVGAGRAPITQVLGAADAAQHAILTRESLNCGIARVNRAGLPAVRSGRPGAHIGGDERWWRRMACK